MMNRYQGTCRNCGTHVRPYEGTCAKVGTRWAVTCHSCPTQPTSRTAPPQADRARIAAQVQKTGLSGGHDLYDLVRSGYLSDNTAMNTDD